MVGDINLFMHKYIEDNEAEIDVKKINLIQTLYS